MKILRLDLLAFGPFTDASLSLDQGDYGLHVVYGPNEAGKSSSLRALTQLLYGIPHISNDNFVHPHKNMRIGAVLQDSSGEVVQCIRRKGKNNVLRAADDVTLFDPGRLEEMLGGVDEVTFRERFGIDCDELRRGGQAIVNGSGDLGQILFAAGAGVADMRPLQEALDKEARDLFKPKGSVQRINKALKDLAAARKAIKQAQLPSAKWDQHNQALRDALACKEQLDQTLLEKSAQKNRLERIGKALPLIARQAQLREQWHEVASAPTLPDDFSEMRRTAMAALATDTKIDCEATKMLDELSASLDQGDVPESLLAHRTTIIKLHTELSRYEKAIEDRPGLVQKKQRAEDEARAILRDLGRPDDLRESETLRLSRPQRLKVQTLGNERKALAAQDHDAAENARQLRDECERLKTQLADANVLPDSGPLRQALRPAQQQGDLDSRIAEAEAEQQRLEEQAAIDLDKLPLAVGSLDAIEKLPVPTAESIERYDAELAETSGHVAAIDQKLDACRQNLQRCDQELETLRLERDVPTEDDLAEARRRRDQAWQWLRRDSQAADTEAEPIEAFIQKFAPGGDLEQAFEASMRAADHVADRLRGEADRVAQNARLTADRHELEKHQAELQTQSESARHAREQSEQSWHALWAPAGIEPLSPREMRSWSRRHAELIAQSEAIRKQRSVVERLHTDLRTHRDALGTALVAMGQPAAASDGTLATMLYRCEDVLGWIDADASQATSRQRELEKVQAQLPAAERHAKQSSESFRQWRTQWAQAVEPLGLDKDSDPAEASSVLEAIDRLFERLKEADVLRRDRIAGIDRDADQFTQLVESLARDIGDVSSDDSVQQTARDLYDRLGAAQRAQAKHDELNKQVQREVAKRDKARTARNEHQAALDVMCREADCASPDELPEAERRSAQRQALQRERKALDEQLVALASGATLDEFLQEAARCDADELPATEGQLSDEIAQLEEQRSQTSETIGSERSELERMDGSDLAADAQEQAEHLAAQIRADTEEYVRVRLASTILDNAMQRYREKNQGPVLARASDLFAELTRGSFVALRADYNDQGSAVLVAVRPDLKQTVGVGGLSDGTESQLYLALRLAMLETHLVHHEPIPFLVDDILKDWDDDRSVAALQALAQLSQKTQVILFTHHRHLVQLAEEHLDSDQVFMHSLDGSASESAPARTAIGAAK